MALINCDDCGKEVSTKASSCPNCGAPIANQTTKPIKKKKSFFGRLIKWTLIVFVALTALGMYLGSNLTPEEQAERDERRAKAEKQEQVKQAKEAQEKAKQEAADKKAGFHCLSKWDGSHSGVYNFVKKRMRDPDSFEHVETKITPVDEKGEHLLSMTYRAKNGFGGMNLETVTAIIKNDNCSAVVNFNN